MERSFKAKERTDFIERNMYYEMGLTIIKVYSTELNKELKELKQ